MPKLKTEYTDIKNIRHTVTHHTLAPEDPASRDRILEEIRNILTGRQEKNANGHCNLCPQVRGTRKQYQL